jgi:hypothetical protein
LIQKWYADVLELLKDMVDVSMFLEWHFLLMSLSTILLFTWFIIPYFYLAEIMVRNGYSEQEASTLLSIIGFSNFLGMVSALLTHDASSEVAFWADTENVPFFSHCPPVLLRKGQISHCSTSTFCHFLPTG